MDAAQTLINRVVEKIRSQRNVVTFFDQFIYRRFETKQGMDPKQIKLFNQLFDAKEKRFTSYEKRTRETCPVSGQKRSVHPLDMLLSQGSHSTIQWRGHDVLKTSYDMIILSMLIDQIQPDVIIELGSGFGGAALWMADMAKGRGLDTHVYSYDIHKPDLSHPNVTFSKYDLTEIGKKNPLPHQEAFTGRKLIIEDAHVNVVKVLLHLDKIAEAGDYLIVEDSDNKQADIAKFVYQSKHSYQADAYYLDFFGRNATCSTDSIFKID